MKTINYSTVTFNELEEIFDIEKNSNKEIFDSWFLNDYSFSEEDNIFLEKLINRNFKNINNYTELELISKVIAPILNMVYFTISNKAIRDFYEAPLKVEYKDIIFSGRCDFVVARGYDSPINPYFFIQEFKQSSSSFPEYQLLSEMIASTIVNNTNKMKGAYVMGSIWVFVVLEKIDEKRYNYYVSKNYDSMYLDDLKQIYKNLQIVKREIYESN